MIARVIVALVFMASVQACGVLPSSVPLSEGEPVEEPEQPDIPEAVPAPAVSTHTFPDLESLLVYRQRACQLPREKRAWLLEEYRQLETPMAKMASLMLATCAPHQTPGLLANSLVSASRLEQTPPGFEALLNLLGAQLDSYALLERQLRQTRKELEDMINGIREIEAEMGREARESGSKNSD